jgi:hypothetical protein
MREVITVLLLPERTRTYGDRTHINSTLEDLSVRLSRVLTGTGFRRGGIMEMEPNA